MYYENMYKTFFKKFICPLKKTNKIISLENIEKDIKEADCSIIVLKKSELNR